MEQGLEKTMSPYEELRIDYANSTLELNEYWRRATKRVSNFIEEFRDYLGAPQTYTDEEGRVLHRYVQLMKITTDENRQISGEVSNNPYSALERGSDGWFTFGVRVMLEPAVNALPKMPFLFSIGFFPRESSYDFRVSGEEFSIQKDDDDCSPVFTHMLKAIKQMLATKPWENFDRKPGIGFLAK